MEKIFYLLEKSELVEDKLVCSVIILNMSQDNETYNVLRYKV
jgi:hypothetical protein